MKKVTLIIITVLFLTIDIQAQDYKVVEQVVGVVGNNMILESQVREQMLQYKAQGYKAKGNMRCEMFEELLIQKLLINQAAIDSIEITDQQVEMEVDRRIQTFLDRMEGDQQKLVEYFGKSMREIKEELRSAIKDQLLTQRMQSEITADIKMTPSEVQKFFKKLPKEEQPKILMQMEYLQIVKAPQIEKSEIDAVIKRMEEFKARVVKGEIKFSTLAAMYSEDPGSAVQGGELGFVSRGTLAPEFAAAAFNLEEGEISDVTETEFGYHLIQFVEKRGQQMNVRHILLKPKVSIESLQKAKNALDSIANEIRQDTITFEQAALKYSDDENSKNNGGIAINPYTGATKFEEEHIYNFDRMTAMYLKDLKITEISDPFETQNEKGKQVYKIIMLKSMTPPHVANLKDDYQQIQDMAIANKKQKIMDTWIVEKQKANFVKIKDEYKDCDYKYSGWLK